MKRTRPDSRQCVQDGAGTRGEEERRKGGDGEGEGVTTAAKSHLHSEILEAIRHQHGPPPFPDEPLA